jgi:myo-inositol-1(or 4)-monophosphatase
MTAETAPVADRWLPLCRAVADDVRAELTRLPGRDEREVVVGRGEGGDDTTAIDRAAERAVVARLDEVHAAGASFRLVSEELGERHFGDGAPWVVVVDPIDGSLNAKRRLPFFCLSIAVADGPTVADVRLAFVHDFATREEWVAEAGRGAKRDGRPLGAVRPKDRLGVVGFEATTAGLVAEAAARLDGRVGRIRILGALALSLCQLADGRLDGVVSLKPTRSVDIAAAALLVREAGATALLVDDPTLPLGLGARTRIVAARDEGSARRLAGLVYGDGVG